LRDLRKEISLLKELALRDSKKFLLSLLKPNVIGLVLAMAVGAMVYAPLSFWFLLHVFFLTAYAGLVAIGRIEVNAHTTLVMYGTLAFCVAGGFAGAWAALSLFGASPDYGNSIGTPVPYGLVLLIEARCNRNHASNAC